jgi:hypothetical protein
MADLPETKFDLWRRYVGAILAPLGFAVLVLLPIPDAFVEAAKGLLKETTATPQVLDVASSARTVLATTWLMVALWLSEAVPLAATAFLPPIAFAVFEVVGVRDGRLLPFDAKTTLLPYAHPVIFLFIGSFLLAGAPSPWVLLFAVVGFMLPMGTAPNLLVYSTGYVSFTQMVRASVDDREDRQGGGPFLSYHHPADDAQDVAADVIDPVGREPRVDDFPQVDSAIHLDGREELSHAVQAHVALMLDPVEGVPEPALQLEADEELGFSIQRHEASLPSTLPLWSGRVNPSSP